MKTGLLIFSLLMLASCGHHRDVRPGPKGVNKVVVTTDEVQKGQRSALDQATHYCKEYKKHPVYLKEEKKYIGTVDEKLYAQAKMASRGAKTASWKAKTNGPRTKNNTADLLDLGASSADAALGDGYTVTMIFKCE